MSPSSSSTSQDASTAVSAQTISGMVLDPETYSVLQRVTKPDQPHHEAQPDQGSSASVTTTTSSSQGNTTQDHHTPSIADLVLDGVTYDAILSSSAKGLDVSPETRALPPPHSPPFPDDVRTPPNSPVVPGPSGNSLMSMLMSRSSPGKREDGPNKKDG